MLHDYYAQYYVSYNLKGTSKAGCSQQLFPRRSDLSSLAGGDEVEVVTGDKVVMKWCWSGGSIGWLSCNYTPHNRKMHYFVNPL